jgi:hypothetical protein
MIAQYLDSYGLPGAGQPLDMGDAAADYFTIIALTQETPDKLNLFWNSTCNCPIRHPDASKWWGQPDRFSRDQLIPLLVLGCLKGNNTLIHSTFVAHLWRGLLFAWNTRQDGAMAEPWKMPDITGPEVLGLWLRVFKPLGYKLLLPICDIETLVNSLLWRFYQPSTNRVTRNVLLVAIAQRQSSTIISWLADKINNYQDLLARWEANTETCGEYPTGPLLRIALGVK